jgi:hypothetical protein
MDTREFIAALEEARDRAEICLDQSGDKWENDYQLTLERVFTDLSVILDRVKP